VQSPSGHSGKLRPFLLAFGLSSHTVNSTLGGKAGAGPARVAVIGTGYVGLTTAVCLAHLGNTVTGVDVDEAKVAQMSAGEPPILEEGLGELLREGLDAGRLTFSCDTAAAVQQARFVFLCVPTPQGADGAADLRFVEQASAQIAPHLEPGAVVVTKSTVPVGSAGKVVAALGRDDVAVVSNPEFLREGRAVEDWLHPDRVVIGAEQAWAASALSALYEPLGAPTVVTDPASSETIKYACNAFLAAKVSFVNSIANLCSAVGANATDVIAGMSFDHRIGADHLAPGPGWGGSCFPKDTQALLRVAEDHGYRFELLEASIRANDAQFDTVAGMVASAAGGDISGVTVAALGLTFKAATDDLRDSPALSVLSRLAARKARLRAFDPSRPSGGDPRLSGLGLEVCDDAYEAARGADVVVVLTEWPEFAELDLVHLAGVMAGRGLVDARNMIDPGAAKAAGLVYVGMGRS
jgi:UDPglucose 6-dehydrogenase